jgi:pimeloyl-ACP methyl ester carboxylesterase
MSACPAWPVGAADPEDRAPVASDLPVLLLAGELDPVTPPGWARQAASTLPRSQMFHFPGVGHGVLAAHPCADRVAAAFLADPERKPFDDCLLNLASGR